jgi:hypothetical protein
VTLDPETWAEAAPQAAASAVNATMFFISLLQPERTAHLERSLASGLHDVAHAPRRFSLDAIRSRTKKPPAGGSMFRRKPAQQALHQKLCFRPTS